MIEVYRSLFRRLKGTILCPEALQFVFMTHTHTHTRTHKQASIIIIIIVIIKERLPIELNKNAT